MVNRTSRLSKNLTDIFGSSGASECRVCANPLGNPRRKYCCDRCQRVAYAVIKLYRWEQVRAYVKERDDYACVNPDCGNDATTPDVTLHVDHVAPLTDAGPAHDPANLQTLCDACNLAKGDGHTDYRPTAAPDGGVPAGSPERALRDQLARERDPTVAPTGRTATTTTTTTATTTTTTMTSAESDQLTADDVTLHDRINLAAIDDLTPYAENPKAHPEKQVEKIKASIVEFGWDQPIVVDDDGEIIKGHGRLEAAKDLGLDRVPVIERGDLSDAERRAARLADNRASESFWDDGLLADELADLDELTTTPDVDLDLDATGFDPDELDDILGTSTDVTTDDDGGTSSGPQDPDEFDTIDDTDVTTDHECPNCGYEW